MRSRTHACSPHARRSGAAVRGSVAAQRNAARSELLLIKVRFPNISSLRTSACVLACAMGAAFATNSQPAAASTGQVTFVEAPGQLLDHHTRRLTIEKLRGLGVTALRLELHWRDVSPAPTSRQRPQRDLSDPASYGWGESEAAIRDAAAPHWEILLTVTGPAPK